MSTTTFIASKSSFLIYSLLVLGAFSCGGKEQSDEKTVGASDKAIEASGEAEGASDKAIEASGEAEEASDKVIEASGEAEEGSVEKEEGSGLTAGFLLVFLLTLVSACLYLLWRNYRLLRNGFRDVENNDTFSLYGGTIKNDLSELKSSINNLTSGLLVKIGSVQKANGAVENKLTLLEEQLSAFHSHVSRLEKENSKLKDGFLLANSSSIIRDMISVMEDVSVCGNIEKAQEIVQGQLSQALRLAQVSAIPDTEFLNRSFSEVHNLCEVVEKKQTLDNELLGSIASVVTPGYWLQSTDLDNSHVIKKSQVAIWVNIERDTPENPKTEPNGPVSATE